MREIKYTLSLDSVAPSAVQDAGYQCEYNATRITFELSDELQTAVSQLEGDIEYVLEVVNSEEVLSIYTLDSDLSIILPISVTIPGTKARLQLAIVALDDDKNMNTKLYTPTVYIKFGPSVTGQLMGGEEYDRYARNLVGTMKVAVTAADTAVNAANSSAEMLSLVQDAHSSTVAAAEAADQDAANAAVSASAAAEDAAKIKAYVADAEYQAYLAKIGASDAGQYAANAAVYSGEAQEAAESSAKTAAEALEYAESAGQAAGEAVGCKNDAQVAAARAEAVANKKWQLISTVTTTGAVQFVSTDDFTAEDNITGIFVRFCAPVAETTNNIYLRVYDSNNTEQVTIGTSGYLSTANATYGKIKCELDKGLWDGWWENPTSNKTGVWTGRQGVRFDCSAVAESDMPYIKKATIGVGNNCTMPVGVTVEIWALK